MIYLNPVSPDNWRLDLKVSEDQTKYVGNTASILARAYAYREMRSKAFVIYDDSTSIGMAMYYDVDEMKAYYFSHFFIDKRYQRKGFGEKASLQIIEKMKEDGKYNKIILCYVEGDEPAKRLYEKLGFIHTGEVDEDEVGMEMIIR